MIEEREIPRVQTHHLAAYVDEEVELRGWLHARREFGKFAFLVIRDASGTAQAVAPKALVTQLGAASLESVLRVTGRVVAREAAPGGAELQVHAVEVISAVTEPLPVTLNKHELAANLGTRLDHAAVTLREPRTRAVFTLSAGAMAGFRRTLTSLGFTEVQTPKLVESATEGGANVFGVEYFGRTAYLAQSPQFYKQTMVGVFERVFEVGPVFRAEPHATSRHINEYVSMDVELGFIRDHTEVMAVLTEVLRGIFEELTANCSEALALLNVVAPTIGPEIPVVTFEEAKRIAGGAPEEPDLSPAEERAVGEWAATTHGSEFVFVTGYPLHKRPFYTHPAPGLPGRSNSFDLLFRGLELVTGGQRLHRFEAYIAALEERGLSPAPFEGYLEAFRYGMPPHGGFAIGLERLLMQLVGAANIREVTLFPRDIARLSP